MHPPGFALVADMAFVQQSAGRLRFSFSVTVVFDPTSLTLKFFAAMFEICLKRGWVVPARERLALCKMACLCPHWLFSTFRY